MGGFYGSVQLRTGDRPRVLAAAAAVAAERGIKCLVGPVLGGWIGVYPEGSGQDDTVGQQIAERVGGYAVHLLVHDDDILAYWLWADGKLLDRYHSSPGYFGEENRAEEELLVGNTEHFAFCLEATGRARLGELLRSDNGPVFAYERLAQLGRLLGITNAVSSYEYLKSGETEEITGWKEFSELPPSIVKAEQGERRAETRRIKAERNRLVAAGTLLFSEEKTETGVIGCAAVNGFIVVWPDYLGLQRTVVQYHRPPWDRPVAAEGLELPTQPHVTGLAADQPGRRLAMACGKLVRVWDWSDDRWVRIADIPEADLTIKVAVSPDGSLVAHASRLELVVTDVATGRRVAAVPRTDNFQQIAFAPDNSWLAVAGDTFGLLSLDGTAIQRSMPIHGTPMPPQLSSTARQAVATIDVEKVITESRTQFEQAFLKLGQQGVKGSTAVTPGELAKMREEAEKMFSDIRLQIAGAKNENAPLSPRRSKEACFCAGFDRSGRWIWIGTTVGIRVYSWPTVLASTDGQTPEPLWKFDVPVTQNPDNPNREVGYVYSAVAEPDGDGLLFGGITAELFRLDFPSGRVHSLVKMPGGGGIVRLSLAADGCSLGICSHFWSLATLKRQQKPRQAWEIWSCAKITRSAEHHGHLE